MTNLLQYASNTDDILRPRWREFWPSFRQRWNQTFNGEHVFIYGETGSGKTDLAIRLANSEPYSVFIVTKPGDPIFRDKKLNGWSRMRQWKPQSSDNHIVLSATPGKDMVAERINQKALLPPALDAIYRAKGWTVVFDEGMHMSTTLGMKQQISDFFYLGRAHGLTGIMCSQRPAWIPQIVPQSCEHAFLSRSRKADDLNRLAELGLDRNEMRNIMRTLTNKHDFVYIDTQGELPVQIVNTHH